LRLVHSFPTRRSSDLADWYKERGYHFVCFSEHNRMQVGDYFVEIGPDKKLTDERVQLIRDRFGDDWVEIRERAGRQQMRLKNHRSEEHTSELQSRENL